MSATAAENVAFKVAPSIFAADLTKLREQIAQASAGGADYIHVDVMDGRFVPTLAGGPVLVEAVRRCTHLPLDVHLMVEEPEHHLADLAVAGASIVTVHVEACRHLHRIVQRIRDLGCRAGVTLNPATPVASLEEILPYVDLVLVMTVNPGLGGQSFIPGMVLKIQRLRAQLDRLDSAIELEVDGGIGPQTAPLVVQAGADVLVAGAAVFGAKDGITRAVARLRQAQTFSRP